MLPPYVSTGLLLNHAIAILNSLGDTTKNCVSCCELIVCTIFDFLCNDYWIKKIKTSITFRLTIEKRKIVIIYYCLWRWAVVSLIYGLPFSPINQYGSIVPHFFLICQASKLFLMQMIFLFCNTTCILEVKSYGNDYMLDQESRWILIHIPLYHNIYSIRDQR